MPALGLTADVDTYNALIWGCSHYGQNASVPKVGACKPPSSARPPVLTRAPETPSVLSALLLPSVRLLSSCQGSTNLTCCCNPQLLEELRGSGCATNSKTHELRVDSAIIAVDIPGMLAALQVGTTPLLLLIKPSAYLLCEGASPPASPAMVSKVASAAVPGPECFRGRDARWKVYQVRPCFCTVRRHAAAGHSALATCGEALAVSDLCGQVDDSPPCARVPSRPTGSTCQHLQISHLKHSQPDSCLSSCAVLCTCGAAVHGCHDVGRCDTDCTGDTTGQGRLRGTSPSAHRRTPVGRPPHDTGRC
jgi:hypothetical protein